MDADAAPAAGGGGGSGGGVGWSLEAERVEARARGACDEAVMRVWALAVGGTDGAGVSACAREAGSTRASPVPQASLALCAAEYIVYRT